MGNKQTGALGGGGVDITSAPPIMRAEPDQVLDTVIGDRANPRTKGANGGTNATAESKSVLHFAVGIVAIALLLLWVMGGIVFKNANL